MANRLFAEKGNAVSEIPERPILVGAWTLHQMRCLDPVVCRAEPSEQERREARAVLVSALCDEESMVSIAGARP